MTDDTTNEAGVAAVTVKFLGAMSATATLLMSLSAPPASAQDMVDGLEEIVVTAQRRTENQQLVPISITTIDDNFIETLGAPRLRDLEYSIPNVLFASSDATVRSTISIRGVSTDDRNIGFETGVGVYIDGVYQGRSASFNQNISDIQRIEVLRGPQGTLYGKNTIAGAFNITTIEPGAELQGKGLLRVGNFDNYEGNGFISGPLIDGKLYGKVSAFAGNRSGYYDNLATGTDLANKRESGGRLQLRATPSDVLELTFSADYANDESDFVESEVSSVEVPPIPGLTPLDLGLAPGLRTVNQDDGIADRDVWGAALTIDLDLASGHTLTAVSGYRDASTELRTDGDRSPFPVLDIFFFDDNRHFSQELRLASPAGRRLNYLFGIYYFDQEAETMRPILIDETALIGFDTGDEYGNAGTVDTEAYALFFNADYALTDRLTLIAGARFNREEKRLRYTQDGQIVFGLPDVAMLGDELEDDDVSPTVGLRFDVGDNVSAYGKLALGYKSGGWNADFLDGTDVDGDGDFDADDIQFEPERVTSYEIGVKSTLFDNRLRLNMAAFFLDYEDLQVSQFDDDCSCRRINNAGQAESFGAELEFEALLTESLELGGGIGWTEAEFTDFPNADGPGTNFKGNTLANAPAWTATLSARYGRVLRSGGELYIGGQYTYRDDYFSGTANDPLSSIDGYSLVNAQIGWISADEGLEVFLWARNLLDEDYVIDRFEESLVFTQEITTYGLPRTYGAQFVTRF